MSLPDAKESTLPKTEMDALLLGRLDELTVSTESRFKGNTFLGILISIVVLSFISTLIGAAIFIANPEITNSLTGERQSVAREAISLEEAMFGELSPNHFASHWVSKIGSSQEDKDDELLYEFARNIQILSLPTKLNQLTKASIGAKNLTLNAINGQLDLQKLITTLVSNSSLLIGSIDFQGFKVSPSKRYLLIWTGKRRQFRHSSTAMYFVYDIQQDMITQLSSAPVPAPTREGDIADEKNTYQAIDTVAQRVGKARRPALEKGDDSHLNDPSQFQLVNWFTINQSDALVLVQANDLYLLTNLTQPNEPNIVIANNTANNITNRLQMHRVSWDGKAGEIFNGLADWLYEEEILADRLAYEFAPNGQKLAFMSFNDSLVEEMPFSLYGDSVIPKVRKIRYPKTGRVNPTVSVRIVEDLHRLQGYKTSVDQDQLENENNKPVYNSTNLRITQLQLPEELANRQHYITQIKWLTNEKLALVWLNRHQNESEILICKANSSSTSSKESQWQCRTNLRMSIANGWLDTSDELVPLNDDSFLALLYRNYEPEVGAFKQIALVKMASPGDESTSNQKEQDYHFITNTHSEVTAINGLDRKRSIVYFTATPAGQPGQRQVYSVPFNEGPNEQAAIGSVQSGTQSAKCLTCDHYPTECLYNAVKFSPSTWYYIFECEGPGVPRVELRLNKLAALSSIDIDLIRNASFALINNNSLTNTSTTTTEAQQQQSTVSIHDIERDQQQADGELSGDSSSSVLVWSIEENKYLRDRLANQLAMPTTVRLSVPLPNTNYSANVLLLLPPQLGFRSVFLGPKGSNLNGAGGVTLRSSPDVPEHLRVGARNVRRARRAATMEGFGQSVEKYLTPETIGLYTSQLATGEQFPMVVDVYAGPGTQATDFRYKINFGHYLASSRRIIYCLIDGRGSGYQGTRRMFELYHKLGTVEIDDQIEAVAQLSQKYSFIDASKIGVWGWSYGGYASAMVLARSQQRLAQQIQRHQLQQIIQDREAALALSPITNQTKPSAATITIDDNTQAAQATDDQASRLASLLLESISGLKQQVGRNSEIVGITTTDNNNNNFDDRKQQNNFADRLTNNNRAKLNPGTGAAGGIFECAASVAPVTNWLLYDTAYTERFMSSPYTNERFDQSVSGDHSSAGLAGAGDLSNIATFKADNNNQQLSNNQTSSTKNTKQAIPNNNNYVKSKLIHQWTRFNQTKLHSLITKMSMNYNANNKQNSHNIINTNSVRSLDINARYKEASLLDRVAFIDRKRYLLIHGTADDNVHFQQSVMLMKRLIQSNVMFESRLYPDQDHSIGNRADKLHLASTLSNFFSECFDIAL